jgi:hypothetical protein
MENKHQESTTPVADATTYEVTAEDVVDVMPASSITQFCTLYDQIADYDLALDSFTDGYGYGQNPSAQEVFDETLSRC